MTGLSSLNCNEFVKIHPALDFTSDHAYIGQFIIGRRDDGSEGEILYLIRNDGRITRCTQVTLYENRLCLLHSDDTFHFDSRWSYDGIKGFMRTPEAHEGTELFDRVKNLLLKNIELSDERLYDLLTLWNLGTYFFPLFNAYPYMYVGGIKGCGKSKLLTLSSHVSFNSIASGNMTTACLYRLIQNSRCTLFIDETENLSNRHRAEDFRNILLNGYKKGLKAFRNSKTTEGNWVPEGFEVYAPKMLANIAGLEDVLESRCISLVMQKGCNKEITDTEIDGSDPIWQQTRDLIYPFVMQNWKKTKQIICELKNETSLICRDWELWKPILVLAKLFGNDALFERMKQFAIEKVAEGQNEAAEDPEIALLHVLQSIVHKDGFYSLHWIKNELATYLGPDYWLTEKQVGNMLRQLGIPKSRRMAAGTEYFLKISQVRALARRNGISEVGELSELTFERG